MNIDKTLFNTMYRDALSGVGMGVDIIAITWWFKDTLWLTNDE